MDAWNRHDLDAIISYYADDVEFWSPLVAQRLYIVSCKVEGKNELRNYFEQVLKGKPDLPFELIQVFWGGNGLTIHYRRQNGLESREMMVLDDHNKVIMARVHHNGPPPFIRFAPLA